MFIILTINYKTNTSKQGLSLVVFTWLRHWRAVWWCLHQTFKRVLCPNLSLLFCTLI